MGQYYHPTILKDDKKTVVAWVYSHEVMETYTRPDGSKYRCGHGLKLMEHSYIGNSFVSAFESLILNNPQRMVWAGDYAEHCKGMKSCVYSRCTDETKVLPTKRPTLKQTQFIVNHSKKQFVDKTKAPKDADGWQVHPLPLLTCEGNGQGGGDYRKEENKFIGVWARDVISVESKAPKGYTEIVPNFEMD